MRAAENCQHLAAAGEILDLRVGPREMTEQVQLLASAVDHERNMARYEPFRTTADEQTEIMLLDMRGQHGGTCFGESGRQIDHGMISSFSARLRQPSVVTTRLASSASPERRRMPPEPRLIQAR